MVKHTALCQNPGSIGRPVNPLLIGNKMATLTAAAKAKATKASKAKAKAHAAANTATPTATAVTPVAGVVAVKIYPHSASTTYGAQLTLPVGVSYKPEAKSYINAAASNATSWAMLQACLAVAPCTMGTLRNILRQAYGHQCFVGYNLKRSKLNKVAYKAGIVQITQAQINTIYQQFGITKAYKNPLA